MIYLGIDPGAKGGIGCITEPNGGPTLIEWLKLDGASERDIGDWLYGVIEVDKRVTHAVIERVASSPQMGVCSAFTFGRSYGFLRGCLSALKIPFVEVSPQKWQKEFGITKSESKTEHKNKLKAKAQQLYPNEKITLATADALLLATFCRRCKDQLF